MKRIKLSKRIISISIIIFSLVISLFSGYGNISVSAADKERKTIRVAYYEVGSMMRGARDNALKSGYAYDYLQKVSYINNWKYEYVYGTFDELYVEFLAGNIDIFPYISYSEDKKDKMLFPRRSMGEEQFYLSVSSDKIDTIDNTPQCMDGRKIGVQLNAEQNVILERFLREKGINAKLVPFVTAEERARALRNGKIDMAFESSILSNEGSILLDKITSQPFYCAVSLIRPELLDELNSANDAILESDPNFLSSLTLKYFSKSTTRKALSAGERNWLSNHPVIRAGGLSGNTPYTYYNNDNEVAGAFPMILEMMFSRMSIDARIEWKLYSSMDELHNALLNNEIDFSAPEYFNYSEAENNRILISDPVISITMGLLYISSEKTDRLGEIATLDTQLSGYYVRDYYPDSIVLPCNTMDECIDMLINDRVSGVIAELSDLESAVRTYSSAFDLTIIPLYSNSTICFSCRPEDSDLVKLINHCIPLLSENEINYLTMDKLLEADVNISATVFFKKNPLYIVLGIILFSLILLGGILLAKMVKAQKVVEHIYSQAIVKNAYSYFKVNLNKNTIIPPIIEKENNVPVDYTDKFGDHLPSFETVMMEGADKFVDDEYKDSYKKFFTCSNLTECFNRGDTMPEYFCKIYSSIIGWHFRRYTAFLSQLKNGTIHAMIVAYDITKELEAEKDRVTLEDELAKVRQTSFISAVAEDFSLVGLYDKSSDIISIVHISPEIQRLLINMNISRKGLTGGRAFLAKLVHPDDINTFYENASLEKILGELAISKVYKFETRLIINGVELYFRIKFSTVESDPNTLVLALINIDDQVRREQERGKLEGYKRAQTFADTFLHSLVSAFYIDLVDYSRIIFHTSETSKNNYYEETNYLDAMISYIMTDVQVEDRPKMLEAVNPKNIRDRLKSEKMYSIYFRDVSNDKLRWLRMDVTRGTDENHAGLSFTDVTEKIIEEEQQRQALEAAQSKAETSNNAKSAFLFNMSHDIRTPMNAIMGFTTMAKKYIDYPERVSNYLDKIDVSGQQLLLLINEVLEVSRIESGKIEFEEKPVDVYESFGRMITIIEEQALAKDLKFRHETKNIIHNRIYADDTRMNKITLNISSNAIKYTPAGGMIDFILEEIPCGTPGYASFVLSVADTGIGMSEDYLSQIFEPFSREQTSTVSKIQGTGLGMSIVKNLVDMMGGNISIESKVGCGTRIDITLSFRLCDEEMQPVVVEEKVATDILDGKRVLLVEDNELNREIATDLLSGRGLIVEEANDGDVAIERIQKIIDNGDYNYYNFILMDVQMPKMDGYTASIAIRSICKPHGINIPIIATTANAFEEDRAKALEAGMNDHIAKPLNIDKLLEILAKYIS